MHLQLLLLICELLFPEPQFNCAINTNITNTFTNSATTQHFLNTLF